MNCVICNSSNTKTVYESNEEFMIEERITYNLEIKLCSSCGFVFLSSAYKKEYEDLLATIYSNFNKSSVLPFPYTSEENLFTRDMILKYLKKNDTILEIGSNRGDMLHLLKRKQPSINILGIEPTANQKAKVPTLRSFFQDNLFSNKFDIIYMQHVLEHIKNPQEIINSIYNLLEDKGYLYIEVPSLDYSLNNFVEDFMLEHVSYFTKTSLINLLADFELIEINEEPFLRLMLRKSNKKKSLLNSDLTCIKKFEKFKNLKKMIHKEIKELDKKVHKRVIFFGVSFYFRKILKELDPFIKECELLFIDDNFKEEIEPTFKLKRAKEFHKNDIIIMCSNNIDVQEKMLKIIQKKAKDNSIFILPWNNIIREKQ